MTQKVVIFSEKPSQAKAYSQAFKVKNRTKTHIEIDKCSIFPNGATITWGIGHLVELKMPGEYKKEWQSWNLKNLPIIPSEFEFKVAKDKSTQFNAVKKLFRDADIIINACDIDREGSNIFYSTLNLTGVKGKEIKRLWINSLEVDEVRKGFSNLQDNKRDLMLYEEAKTRQLSDWLVGINASQLYTLLLAEKGVRTTLSVGRVQSPLVYMIYQRQEEIENFKPEPFYELFGKFSSVKGTYEGKAKIKEKEKITVEQLLKDNSIPENDSTPGKVKQIEKKRKKRKSPLLHSLSTLQTVANKKWKYSPSVVLKTMQSLYEKKIVTYPRTDCNYITDSEFEYLCRNIDQYQKLLGVKFDPHLEAKKRHVDNSKVQEHYAIIPTKTIPTDSTLGSLTDVEKNIYYEVLKTTLAMFHNDYEYEETSIITDVNSIEFHTKGKVEIELGWKVLFKEDTRDTSDTNNTNNITLPNVSEGETVDSTINIKEGITTPPKPYTEGQLINLMKTAGRFVEDEEDSEILKEVEGIGTEATRSGIIETIKKNEYIEVKRNIVSVTNKGKILCEVIEGSLLSSPSMTAKWETYLKKIGQGKGSQEVFLKQIERFIDKMIREVPNRIEKSTITEKIKVSQQEESIGKCPSCNGQMVDKGTFYGCTEYRHGCKVTISKKIAGKTITKTNIKKLLKDGKTNIIKGFKSKKGKTFDAYLKWDNSQSKITFEFRQKQKQKA